MPYDNVAMFVAYLESLRRYIFVNKHRLNQLKAVFLEAYRKKTDLNIDDDILHFFLVRYMVMMTANEYFFMNKRHGLRCLFIAWRMVRLFEAWVADNINSAGGCAKFGKIRQDEDSLQFWAHGLKRGEAMLAFLQSLTGPLQGKRLLDIGAGSGGISIAFAQQCQDVTAIDSRAENIELFQRRIRDRNLHNIHLRLGDAANLMFSDETFDIVIINGVLEWVAYGRSEQPFSLQQKALAEAYRVLKKGGVLYLAIENRWYPLNVFRDPHARLPLVCVLSRRLASLFSQLFSGKPYENLIYSYWALKNILRRTGFSKIDIYAPLLNYQYPVAVINLEQKDYKLTSGQLGKVYYEYRKMNLAKGLKAKIMFARLIFLLRMAKLFSHGFIAIGYKQ